MALQMAFLRLKFHPTPTGKSTVHQYSRSHKTSLRNSILTSVLQQTAVIFTYGEHDGTDEFGSVSPSTKRTQSWRSLTSAGLNHEVDR